MLFGVVVDLMVFKVFMDEYLPDLCIFPMDGFLPMMMKWFMCIFLTVCEIISKKNLINLLIYFSSSDFTMEYLLPDFRSIFR